MVSTFENMIIEWETSLFEILIVGSVIMTYHVNKALLRHFDSCYHPNQHHANFNISMHVYSSLITHVRLFKI